MIIRKRINLFPIIFRFKKYGLNWHRIGYCCGLTFYEVKFILLLNFLFKDVVYYRCPQCGKKHGIKLSYHTETYYDKEIREENKLLKEW